MPLLHPVPELSGGTIIVTGSGRRLREVSRAPQENLAPVVIPGMGANRASKPRRVYVSSTSPAGSIHIWRFTAIAWPERKPTFTRWFMRNLSIRPTYYEYLNLTNHGLAEGLSDAEIHRICEAFNVKQSIFEADILIRSTLRGSLHQLSKAVPL